jgi:hypothetical protein
MNTIEINILIQGFIIGSLAVVFFIMGFIIVRLFNNKQ